MFETQTNRSGKVLSASCVGRKALLGIYYNNCFALDQNTNFLSDFFFFLLYDDKENKRGKEKDRCHVLSVHSSLVLAGCQGVRRHYHVLNWC